MDGELFSHPLAHLTSWRIGGCAERYYCPRQINELKHYLHNLPLDLAITWLGLGSNVLIRDGGITGAVIATRHLQTLSVQEDNSVFAQAGVSCAKFARFCQRLGFGEAAFFAGIPGTIGGALAMNAGAFGSETWQWVKTVWVINRQGQTQWRLPADYQIAYRSVVGPQPEAFIGATFLFAKNPDDKIRHLLRQRAQTQPIGTFNCGSVYRNPGNDFAARLIEACQLKGFRIGDALVSPKHANFIINCGHATSKQVEALMKEIESRVNTQFGIQLQAEVKILGNEEDHG